MSDYCLVVDFNQNKLRLESPTVGELGIYNIYCAVHTKAEVSIRVLFRLTHTENGHLCPFLCPFLEVPAN